MVCASLSLMPIMKAAVSCGTAIPGVLRVGILPDNLPFSAVSSGVAVGFDPLLVTAVAQLLGYDSVQFTGFASSSLALTALTAGTIDVYANSGRTLAIPPTTYIGVVTDISALDFGDVSGWAVTLGCCSLALSIEAAITQLVENGTYAQILQTLRLNNLTAGDLLGFPVSATGVLLQPFPFASRETGTIPSTCTVVGPISLPAKNCISAFLQLSCSGATTTFTGATGLIG